MFPPYALTPRQFLHDYTYRHLRVFGIASRDRIAAAEREQRHGGLH